MLLIDDNADNREAIALLLRRGGYSVVEVVDGAEAMRVLRTGLRPCIIVSDLMMPDRNGYEFRLEQLADPQLANIPFIAYSGVTDARHNTAHLYPAACLQIPFEIDLMLWLVNQHCDRAPVH
ncbi:MAG TPA: response regulator [Burkholderiales bacterium]|nr:response regulator [Burkholderiales bacterium]